MGCKIRAGDEDVVEVDEREVESSTNVIHLSLEYLAGVTEWQSPNGILKNSIRPKGATTTVFGTSSGAISTW